MCADTCWIGSGLISRRLSALVKKGMTRQRSGSLSPSPASPFNTLTFPPVHLDQVVAAGRSECYRVRQFGRDRAQRAFLGLSLGVVP